MTATTTLAPAPSSAVPHRLGFALRAIRAFGSAAVGVVLLGSYQEGGEHGRRAGVRAPRPAHLGHRPGRDRPSRSRPTCG
ncbi:hypothetical protein ABZV60_18155 [Streptomyces sp. NPDC004787]|uniref:hypothetical protein n=1 Tax=Streptomyces sp. NPDC004787 TaxID=3154291 RepID=UPI0033B91752